MKTLLIALCCLCLSAAPAARGAQPAQNTSAFDAFWPKFRSAVARGDREAVAAMTRFPLTMPYGVPAVKTKAQFLQRYARIFDAASRKCLAAGRPERENDKSARYNILCRNAMLYEFDLVGGAYRLVAVDNANE